MNYEQEKAVLELGDAIAGVMEAFDVTDDGAQLDSKYLNAKEAALKALGLAEANPGIDETIIKVEA